MSNNGGRRKVKIERIDNEEARQVCFSKRRVGLFGKASELATLCKAESVLVVYSPAGNPYCFGTPRFKDVADRFLFGNTAPTKSISSGLDGHGMSMTQQLSAECSQLSSQVWNESEKKSLLEKSLDSLVQKKQAFQFVNDMERLELVELEHLKESLDLLRARIDMKLNEILLSGSALSSNVAATAVNQFEAGNGHAHQGGPRFY